MGSLDRGSIPEVPDIEEVSSGEEEDIPDEAYGECGHDTGGASGGGSVLGRSESFADFIKATTPPKTPERTPSPTLSPRG